MRVLTLLACLPILAAAKDLPVANVAAFDEAVKAAQPGDTILLSEAEWRDAVLKFKGAGTKDAPITLKAATPGKAILTGKTQVKIGGEYLVVEGLHIRNQDPAAGDSVEFRIDSKNLARHCRLTNCAITQDTEIKGAKESRWVGIYGDQNQVDHCLIQGKTTKGTTLVVWLGEGQEARHTIDHNYFGPREKLGKNGGETIRIGDSKTSMQTAACVIENNLFEKCNGEAECISNKSCGNIYRGNTFVEVSGTLTLRHGNGCLVEGNGFFGNHANGTGGIRIIGEDHIVRGNYLENLAGEDARCAITFMLGIPNSVPHGYFQVKRARVENNSIVNCEHPILFGQEGSTVEAAPSLPPVDTTMIGNQVHAPESTVVEARCDISGIKWQSNTFFGKELGIPAIEGITWAQSKPVSLKAMPRDDAGPSWWK